MVVTHISDEVRTPAKALALVEWEGHQEKGRYLEVCMRRSNSCSAQSQSTSEEIIKEKDRAINNLWSQVAALRSLDEKMKSLASRLRTLRKSLQSRINMSLLPVCDIKQHKKRWKEKIENNRARYQQLPRAAAAGRQLHRSQAASADHGG